MGDDMTNDDRPSDPLARALAKLAPVPAGLNTPAFLYAAGAADAARGTAFWKRLCLGQTGLMTVAAGIAAVWFTIAPMPTAPDGAQAQIKQKSPPLELAPHPREHAVGLPDYLGKPERIGFRGRPDHTEWSDAEIAYYLLLRNDVAAAGLGMLPSWPSTRLPFLERDGNPIGPPVFAVPPSPKNNRN